MLAEQTLGQHDLPYRSEPSMIERRSFLLSVVGASSVALATRSGAQQEPMNGQDVGAPVGHHISDKDPTDGGSCSRQLSHRYGANRGDADPSDPDRRADSDPTDPTPPDRLRPAPPATGYTDVDRGDCMNSGRGLRAHDSTDSHTRGSGPTDQDPADATGFGHRPTFW